MAVNHYMAVHYYMAVILAIITYNPLCLDKDWSCIGSHKASYNQYLSGVTNFIRDTPS